MSTQTGIKANDALKKFFGQSRSGKIRAFKVSIESEQLIFNGEKKAYRSWEEDFEPCIQSLIVENIPCYILYRLDTRNTSGFDWLLISWSPDTAHVRQKMLYASTKATLKLEFGSGDIKDELHATTLDEVSLRGYIKHKEDLTTPQPLTNREEEIQELRKTEIAGASEIGIDTKQQTISGVAFPITENARNAIIDLSQHRVDYVQLKIDINEERIHLAEAARLQITDLNKKIPTNTPRYHLYNFAHTHEGDYIETIVFIYSMPSNSASIKERMLYSSCKGPLIENILYLGINIDKKLEVDGDEEITEQFLYDEVHPKVNLHRPKFDKPKGPPNRGAKRITKSITKN